MTSGAFCPACHGAYRQDSGHMLACDSCSGWVHARCDSLSPAELKAIEQGSHGSWGSRYICPVCRRSGAGQILGSLFEEDRRGGGYFYAPVTEEVAPGYFNVISKPMALEDVASKLARGLYDTPGLAGMVTMRADCELIVRNALVFNTPQDKVYTAAWRLLRACSSAFSRVLPMVGDTVYRGEFERLKSVIKDPKVLAEAQLPPRGAISNSGSGSGSGSGGVEMGGALVASGLDSAMDIEGSEGGLAPVSFSSSSSSAATSAGVAAAANAAAATFSLPSASASLTAGGGMDMYEGGGEGSFLGGGFASAVSFRNVLSIFQ